MQDGVLQYCTSRTNLKFVLLFVLFVHEMNNCGRFSGMMASVLTSDVVNTVHDDY